MAIRKLTYALAAGAMTLGATAQAAASFDAPIRSSAPVGEAEQLSGNTGLVAVVIGVLAILSILVFEGDDDPVSP